MIKTIFNLYESSCAVCGNMAPDWIITRHRTGDEKEQIVQFSFNDIGKMSADEFQRISLDTTVRRHYLRLKPYGEIDPSNPVIETNNSIMVEEDEQPMEFRSRIHLEKVGTITVNGRNQMVETKVSVEALPSPHTDVNLF